MREGLLFTIGLLLLLTPAPNVIAAPSPAAPASIARAAIAAAFGDPGDEKKTPPRRRVFTQRRTEALSIDGHAERAWAEVPVISEFTQRVPDEGAPASQHTEVRVMYDDEAIYVFAHLYDTQPDSIVARLGRRDADLESDHFVFFIDPYHDRRSGYYFGVNAAGTLYDGVLMNDEWDDDSWDGVWQAKTSRTEEGWTAEMRIPYSQIRFYEKEEHTWGVNFRRGIARRNEQSFLVHVPRDESGFVSRFADMEGLQNISPRRQVELTPYSTVRAEYTDQPGGNPFNDGSRYVPGFGADLKVGLTSNLTLNATVNPDFGQVEVDPAVVNLSDVETFFPEKRPFFIDGAEVFDGFGRGGANNNWGFHWGNPDFFYSRRIGRSPQGPRPGGDYVDDVEGTRILGATKLTGRLGQGWKVGVIQAVTERGMMDYQLDQAVQAAEVEPLAYYGVFRTQREFREGRQALGFLSTVAKRDFNDPALRDYVNSDAYVFGVDGWTFLDADKRWVVTGWMGATHVRGTQERMLSVQTNSLHYFQRPDLDAVSVDSSATSLSGLSGRFMLNKQQGRFTVNAAFGFITPGFDNTDLGFIWQTNVLNGHVAASYAFNEPTTWYRMARINGAVFRSMDFDGNTTGSGIWTGNYVQFLNYHSVFFNVAYNPQTVSNRRTRGGPLMANPGGVQFGTHYNSDSRKAWTWGLNAFTYTQERENSANLGVRIGWQPAANLSVQLSPSVNLNHEFAQYVGRYADDLATATYGNRYVFAELDQVTFSSSVRLNWTFTPELSVQLFAQPLISSGEYQNYKELTAPKTYDFLDYGTNGSTYDAETLTADPDGAGPAAALTLPQQDFNFKSLRGTAVLRWEYSPGSTVYLVWTQSRSDYEQLGDFNFGPSMGRLFDAKPDNIFMVKLTYWLSR